MSQPIARRIVTTGCISVGLAVVFAIAVGRAADNKVINMNDQCDPETFNSEVGSGTCLSSHAGVKFDNFLRELGKTQKVGAWNFAPGEVRLRDGETFQAFNAGGEDHTFTEVEEFGGGIIPPLNILSGNPVPAPECLDPNLEFVHPGDVTAPEDEEPGVHHYQCCIHPWMRVDVTVR